MSPKKKTGNRQGHHVIPISIGGHHVDENVVYLNKEDHDLVHDTLNLDSKPIREFRKAVNHILFPNEHYVHEMVKIQRGYFENVDKLPLNLQWVHADSLRKQVWKLKKLYNLKNFHIKDMHDKTYLHQIRYYLSCYHNMHWIMIENVAQVIGDMIEKGELDKTKRRS